MVIKANKPTSDLLFFLMTDLWHYFEERFDKDYSESVISTYIGIIQKMGESYVKNLLLSSLIDYFPELENMRTNDEHS